MKLRVRPASRRRLLVLLAMVAAASLSTAAPGLAQQAPPAVPGAWTPAGDLAKDSLQSRMALLHDGRVFLLGRDPFDGAATGHIFDPATRTWAPLVLPPDLRLTEAVLLAGPNCVPNCGKVLVAASEPGDRAYLYDPGPGSWEELAGPTNASYDFDSTATALADGRMLVSGGNPIGSPAKHSLYDPSTNAWSATGSPTGTEFVRSHSVSLLSDGRVLMAGGGSNRAGLFDPASGTISFTGDLVQSRYGHTATRLSGAACGDKCGSVLAVGGLSQSQTAVDRYDPGTGAWTSANPLLVPRYLGATATALACGVLVVAGETETPTGETTTLASTELYFAETGLWAPAPRTIDDRGYHGAALLADGQVLVAGGAQKLNAPGPNRYRKTSETFLPPPECIPKPDLVLTKTAAPNPVAVGEDLVYTLNVANPSGDDAPGVKVVDTLPAGVVVKSTSPDNTCQPAGTTVTCWLGTVRAGATTAVTIVVTGAGVGSITNTATVTSLHNDANPADNTDSVLTDPCPAGSAAPDMAAGPSGEEPGAPMAAGVLEGGVLAPVVLASAGMTRHRRRRAAAVVVRRWRRIRGQGGFTLIELLVVIVIIGVLSAIVVFAVRGAGDKGAGAASKTDVRTLRTAQEAFCAQYGRYAESDAQLVNPSLADPSFGTKGFLSEESETHEVTAVHGGGSCGGWSYTITGIQPPPTGCRP